jgi:hypothetical protein
MTPEEQITEIKTDLLRVHGRILRLNGALDRLTATIQADAAPSADTATATPGHTTQEENSSTFQRNVLVYAQRRIARQTLQLAVNAGALIPRNDLGFVIDQADSSDEEIDIFCLRPVPPAEYRDTLETDTTETNVEPTPEGAPTETTRTARAPVATQTPSRRNQIPPVSARTARQNRRQRTAIGQAQEWIVGYRERSEQRVRRNAERNRARRS